MIAAGHLFHPTLATSGIEWLPEKARLHHDGRVVAEAWHDTPTPYAFFHSLRFVTAFPEVSEWWFGENWQARVKVHAPEGLLDPGTLYGYAQYGKRDTPLTRTRLARGASVWTVTDEAPALIACVLPLGAPVAALTLRLAVARRVVAQLQRDANASEWVTVTSRVARADLEMLLPTDHREPTTDLPRRLTALVNPEDALGLETDPRRWALEETPDLSLRDLFCQQLGLPAPEREWA